MELHCVHDQHLKAWAENQVPYTIAAHERVAEHYGCPSVNLSREVRERIAAGPFTWAGDFRDLHPSPYGQQVYAHSITRLLDAAWREPAPAAKAHPVPSPLDSASYERGRFGDVKTARIIRGFTPEPHGQPTDQKEARAGCVKVPALVATTPDAAFEFTFAGTGVGLMITSGPDARTIAFRIDDRPEQTLDTRTAWSQGLHLPWALMLEDSPPPANTPSASGSWTARCGCFICWRTEKSQEQTRPNPNSKARKPSAERNPKPERSCSGGGFSRTISSGLLNLVSAFGIRTSFGLRPFGFRDLGLILILLTAYASSAQTIVCPPDAPANVKLAAKAIRRYVFLRTGSQHRHWLTPDRPFELSPPHSLPTSGTNAVRPGKNRPATSAFGFPLSVLCHLPSAFSAVGPPLSHPLCQDRRMKLHPSTWFTRDEGETIAVFGDARLVKKLDGKLELRGGSPGDRSAAKEWCSLFLHEAAVA